MDNVEIRAREDLQDYRNLAAEAAKDFERVKANLQRLEGAILALESLLREGEHASVNGTAAEGSGSSAAGQAPKEL